MTDSFRLRVGAIALILGAVALFIAQRIRPDAGHVDVPGILRSVQASSGAASTASLLYLAAAALLVTGFVAVPSAIAAGRGSRLIYATAGLTAVGAVWYGVEAALMQFVAVLAGSPDVAAAAAQLDRLNAGFGTIALLPWFFYLAPLGVAIALRRAQLVGVWLIGLWALGFLVGFTANSPLGESMPGLAVVNDAALSAIVVAIGLVVAVRRSGSPGVAAEHSVGTQPSSAAGAA